MDLKVQLCWALGNIAVDCNACKAVLIQHKCPQQVIMLLLQGVEGLQSFASDRTELASQTNSLSNLLWTLTNMVRGNADVSYLQDLPDAAMLALLSLLAVREEEAEGVAPMARWLFTFLTSKNQALFDRLLSLRLYEVSSQTGVEGVMLY